MENNFKDAYFEPFDSFFIEELQKAIEEFQIEKNILKYELEIFDNDTEARLRSVDHQDNLILLESYKDFESQLSGNKEPSLSCYKLFRGLVDIQDEMFLGSEEISTLLVGLMPLKNEKKFYTKAQVKLWLDDLRQSILKSNEYIGLVRAIDDHGQKISLSEIILGSNDYQRQIFPSRLDGLSVDFAINKLIHTKCIKNSLFKLFWSENGTPTLFTEKLVKEVSNRIGKQINNASSVYQEWINSNHPKNINSDYVIDWANNLESKGFIGLNLKSLIAVFEQERFQGEENQIEPKKSTKRLEEKVTKDEKRRLYFKGWLDGKNFNQISENHGYTQQRLWDELGKNEPELFPPMSSQTIDRFFNLVKLVEFNTGRPKKVPK